MYRIGTEVTKSSLMQTLQLDSQSMNLTQENVKLFFSNATDLHNSKEEDTPTRLHICYHFKHFLLTFNLQESIENQYTVLSKLCTLKCLLGFTD